MTATVELTDGPVIGFLVSFPFSPGAPMVDYQVNRIYDIYKDLFAEEEDDDA
jgi:hypothetical protein